MQTIDWILLIAPMLIVLGIGLYTQSYMKSVADFMTSGRMAGRYLLAVAKAESQAGAVVFVALFELTAKAGFTVTWWQWIQAPVMLGVAISGFMFYRYRETRAMTLAQFFEIRYSRKFRLFTGGLGFLAGILNFGIIPSVGAQFFVKYQSLRLSLDSRLLYSQLKITTYGKASRDLRRLGYDHVKNSNCRTTCSARCFRAGFSQRSKHGGRVF